MTAGDAPEAGAERRRLKLLLACEFYHPSRGGVQEVMRQLAERFAAAGHDVTVATTMLPERSFSELNGVRIEGFHIWGNHVRGLEGEVERYRAFLRGFDGDAVMIKAAQQWTFDASWPALDDMACRKVFIPCGFSALYEPAYAGYFEALPAVLAKFDSLIFYAEDYRDINFAREHGLTRLDFLPNGASEKEFGSPPEPGVRARLGVPDDALLLITVGTPVTNKGHLEVTEAFERLSSADNHLALVLNGQWGVRPVDLAGPEDQAEADADEPAMAQASAADRGRGRVTGRGASAVMARALLTLQRGGASAFLRRSAAWMYYRSLWLLMLPARPALPVARRGLHALRMSVHRSRRALHGAFRLRSPPPAAPPPPQRSIDEVVADIRRDPRKTVLQTELPREEVVELFFAADLFVFASKVEYSPLVLFESCAAGLPFITVPAGNAAEIVRWTGGGVVCPASRDELGFVKVEPAALAAEIGRLLGDRQRLKALGAAGRSAWRERYSWDVISRRYLAILAAGRADGP